MDDAVRRESQFSVEEVKDTGDWVRSLFTSYDDLLSDSDLEAKLSGIVREFLLADRTGSSDTIEELAREITSSRIPIEPSNPDQYLDYLATNVIPHCVHTSSPRFIGHMTSALPHFVRPLSGLVTALNQNMVKIETSKVLTAYERQSIAMMHRQLFGLGDQFYNRHLQHGSSTLGMVVSGGTVANITALWCARNACLGSHDSFRGVEREGLGAALQYYGYKGAVIAGSALMHYSFDKAAGLLGFGTEGILKIAPDSDNRIDLIRLRETLEECRRKKLRVIAIVGVAGTTDCGSVDPISEMAEIARECDAHFHVDAAWGGPCIFSERNRHKLAGIELADSVTIDCHKQMYLPLGIGMLLLRNPVLGQGIEKHARYIIRANSLDLGKRSLEGSRPALIVLLHAALNLLGRKGYEWLIDEGIRKAEYMARSIRDRSEFELLADPTLNILVYRYLPLALRQKRSQHRLTPADNDHINRCNESLQRIQRQSGRSFVSRTSLDLKFDTEARVVTALRAVLANPLTTENDIEAVLEEQKEIGSTLN